MRDSREAGNGSAADIECPEGSPARGERSESKPPVCSTGAGTDHTGSTRSKIAGALFACGRHERESKRGNRRRAECDMSSVALAKGEGREIGKGSLSIFIVVN